MPDLGVYVNEKSTQGMPLRAAESGIAYVTGTAPVHTAKKPAAPGVPVLCASWEEAVERLGYSEDWEKYSLCEVMFAYFRLYGCQPVLFCNVLDPEKARTEAASKEYPVEDHRALLPYETLLPGLTVKTDPGAEAPALTEGEDYSVFYDGNAGACVIELLEDGTAYSATALTVEAGAVDPGAVTEGDVAVGVAQADACMNRTGLTPDLLLAPGWSQKPAIAALLAVKAGSVNTLLRAKALVDIDSTAAGVTDPGDLLEYKTKNSLTDPALLMHWPMVTFAGKKFHLSTHLAALMAQVDGENGGVPYASPAGNSLKIDGCCLADGTEVSLTFDQVNRIAGHQGIVTALYFGLGGWQAKGNYTACYPQNSDPKDCFIPNARMFTWVGNTLVKNFWARLDKPMTRRLADDIVDGVNQWLNALQGSGYIYGGRVSYEAQENPLSDLLEGIIKFHIYIAPPFPAQKIVFTLEYDLDYVTAALSE